MRRHYNPARNRRDERGTQPADLRVGSSITTCRGTSCASSSASGALTASEPAESSKSPTTFTPTQSSSASTKASPRTSTGSPISSAMPNPFLGGRAGHDRGGNNTPGATVGTRSLRSKSPPSRNRHVPWPTTPSSSCPISPIRRWNVLPISHPAVTFDDLRYDPYLQSSFHGTFSRGRWASWCLAGRPSRVDLGTVSFTWALIMRDHPRCVSCYF